MQQGEKGPDKPMEIVRAYRTANELKLDKSIQYRILKSFYRLWHQKEEYAADEQDSVSVKYGRLKELVCKDAAWSDIRAACRSLLSSHPSARLAAWYCELCFLNRGTGEATAAVAHYLGYYGVDFYFHIHPRIREKVALTYLSFGRQNQLGQLLMHCRNQEWFNSTEKSVFFLYLCSEKKDSLAFHYYQKFHRDIEKLASHKGGGIPGLGGIRLRAARIAHSLGRSGEAALLCRKISPSEPEYKEALYLLHQCGSHQDLFRQSDLRKNLLACKDQQQRLNLFREALIRARQNGPDVGGEFLSLNAFFSELKDWFDQDADCLRSLGQLFLEYRELEEFLPDYWSWFLKMALVPLPGEKAVALWGPFASVECPGSGTISFLKGAGILHLVLRGEHRERQDEEVFLARDLILEVHQKKSLRLRKGMPDWRQIWSVAISYISESSELSAARKGILLKLVNAAKSMDGMPLEDIEAYLDLPKSRPPASVLNAYLSEAQERHAPDLELKVLLKMPERFSHFTNDELKRIWHISARQGYSDLAWRSLSILACRTQLPVVLDKHLLLSGERRNSPYPYLAPESLEFDSCLIGLTPEQAKFVWACLKVGGKVPSLLAKISPAVRMGKSVQIKKVLGKSDKATLILDGIKWLKSSGGFTRSHDEEHHHIRLPAFSERLPDNPWSLLVSKIAVRMAVGSWSWRTGVLKNMLGECTGKRQASWRLMGTQDGYVSQWLKTLDHEQRNAWHDLSQLSHRLDDEAGFYALAVFMCRLATVIYPDHFGALQSLRQMRAPVFLIWELEKWILSREYSGIREQKGTGHRVPVPASLRADPVW